MLFSAFAFSSSPFGEEFVSGVQNASATTNPALSVLASYIRLVLRDAEIAASSSSTLNVARVRLNTGAAESTLSSAASAFLTANRGALVAASLTTSASGGYVKISNPLVDTVLTFRASGREKWEPLAADGEAWSNILAGSQTWGTIPTSSETWTQLP